MRNILTNPRSVAIFSLMLALPGAVLFSLFLLHIEPPLGPLEPLVTAPVDQPNIIGSAIALTLILFLPIVAFIINLGPIMRNARAGNSIAANPTNLLVAAAILFIITMFVGGIIVDQYPCWVGVPNCD